MTDTLKTELGQDTGANAGQAPTTSRAGAAGTGRKRLFDIVSQSVGAVGDQGFFALGNFAITTILARQVSQGVFGQFSAAFAAFMLLAPIYCGLVTDPMLVYGASTLKNKQRSYVRQVVVLHWIATSVIFVVLGGVGLIRSHTGLGRGSFLAYLGWAIAAPAVLRLWLARRTAYLVSKPHYSAFAGAIYLVIIVALLMGFGSHLVSNAFTPCLFIAAASLVVAFFLHRRLRLIDRDPAPVHQTVELHWKFGKWAGSAGMLSLLPDYVYFFVLAPELCGHYRALSNVVLPLTQIYGALGILLTAYFARYRERPDFTRIVLRTSAAFCGIAVLTAAVVVTLGGRVFYHLYGGKYDLSFMLLLPLGIVSVLFAVKAASDAIFRAVENVAALAVIAAVGAIAALVLGAPLALRYGIRGAVYGNLSVYAIVTTAIAVLWIRRWRSIRTKAASVGQDGAMGSVQFPHLTVAETPIEPLAESRW